MSAETVERYREAQSLDLLTFEDAALAEREGMRQAHEATYANELTRQRQNLVTRLAQDASDDEADMALLAARQGPDLAEFVYDDPSDGPSDSDPTPGLDDEDRRNLAWQRKANDDHRADREQETVAECERCGASLTFKQVPNHIYECENADEAQRAAWLAENGPQNDDWIRYE